MTGRRRQRGLTLLEALVTLVITAMVAALMTEGLFQLGQVEKRLGTGQLEARLDRLHLLWVMQALEGLRPGEVDTPDQLFGDRRTVRGVSSLLPMVEHAGPMPVSLSMAYKRDVGQTELTMTIGEPGQRLQTAVLARWKGEGGHFSYLDPSGTWLSDWPPALQTPPLLPKAIAVYADGEALVLVAAMHASPQALGKRITIEKLP